VPSGLSQSLEEASQLLETDSRTTLNSEF
jgi:hypothetical protein